MGCLHTFFGQKDARWLIDVNVNVNHISPSGFGSFGAVAQASGHRQLRPKWC